MHAGLAALVDPGAVAALLASYEGDRPFVVHGARAGIAELLALPVLASIDAMLSAWPEPVEVHLPDVADEASSVSVSPHHARAMFASGMGLLFSGVQRYSPTLAPWLRALRVELGLSALTESRCLVYATPPGVGTAPHFDQNVNFVLQVHGTKTWFLAPNTHVARPLTRHTMGQEPDPELASYAGQPLPTALPADRTEIVLEPGSVLFVPRGMWHATTATTASLQLNFTFSPPSWLDVLTTALRSRLAQSRRWRETATPLDAARFDALLRELADDAAHWSGAEILAATEAADAPSDAGDETDAGDAGATDATPH